MAKILVLLFGAAVCLGCVYFYVRGQAAAVTGEHRSAPKQTVDNVRAAAKNIENDAQKRADEFGNKAGAQ